MHIFCFKDMSSNLPYSCTIVIACTRGQRDHAAGARKGCRTALLAACHSCSCNHESTASSETPSQMARKAVLPPLCKSRWQQGTPTPTTLSCSPHSAKRQAKLELQPGLNKCVLLAMGRGCCLNKHPRIAL